MLSSSAKVVNSWWRNTSLENAQKRGKNNSNKANGQDHLFRLGKIPPLYNLIKRVFFLRFLSICFASFFPFLYSRHRICRVVLFNLRLPQACLRDALMTIIFLSSLFFGNFYPFSLLFFCLLLFTASSDLNSNSESDRKIQA